MRNKKLKPRSIYVKSKSSGYLPPLSPSLSLNFWKTDETFQHVQDYKDNHISLSCLTKLICKKGDISLIHFLHFSYVISLSLAIFFFITIEFIDHLLDKFDTFSATTCSK